jgi:hypothetical protein
MQRHRLDADVARAACRALFVLVMMNTANQERAAALGLIESVMAIFIDHPVTDRAASLYASRLIGGRDTPMPPKLVAALACDAIGALAFENPANQDRAGAAGACEAVVKLLLVRLCVSLLCSLLRCVRMPILHVHVTSNFGFFYSTPFPVLCLLAGSPHQ